MTALQLATVITGLAVVGPACAGHSGATIAISDSLAARGDQLPVREGASWAGRISPWRFGDYAVVSSHLGGTHSSTRSNIVNTRTESRISQEFSFVLANHSSDSAWVNAARNGLTQSRTPLNLGHGWFLGDSVVRDQDSFAATIIINRDTSDTWMLRMDFRRNTEHESDRGMTNGVLTNGVLTSGERRVTIVPLMVNSVLWPAQGCEFVEDGRSLAAVQFFGNHRFVWLDRTLDDRTRLILAAAMTAVLQNSSQ